MRYEAVLTARLLRRVESGARSIFLRRASLVAEILRCAQDDKYQSRGHRPKFKCDVHLAKATPILMLRNRAGEAPWPVPMVCMGWPFPQLGVPQSVQSSREQIASQLFQNSVVMPL